MRMIIVLCTCVVSLHSYAVSGFSFAKTEAPAVPEKQQPNDAQRRVIFSAPVVAVSSLICLQSGPAHAFDNAVPDYSLYADKPKRRGTPPKDLGVLPRTTEGEDDRVTAPGLRACDGNPNCFSTTGDFLLSDRQQYGVDFLIQPWKFPANDPKPLQTLSSVVKSYAAGREESTGEGLPSSRRRTPICIASLKVSRKDTLTTSSSRLPRV
ncbi:hypothetical protein ACHAXR_013407 [Thalassiosira sp. AJA248-18]